MSLQPSVAEVSRSRFCPSVHGKASIRSGDAGLQRWVCERDNVERIKKSGSNGGGWVPSFLGVCIVRRVYPACSRVCEAVFDQRFSQRSKPTFATLGK